MIGSTFGCNWTTPYMDYSSLKHKSEKLQDEIYDLAEKQRVLDINYEFEIEYKTRELKITDYNLERCYQKLPNKEWVTLPH